jgi:4-diphosphocytidyl-2-C-methyl-D-erythritol kinase
VKVSVPSLAKLNLDLRVLHKRSDGFHELRTVFQTISLRDQLTIEFESARRTRIDLNSSTEIPDNLVVRAARLILERLEIKAWVRFSLSKRIPMGAGLGGGSSNAASTLIALAALSGRRVAFADLADMAGELGSDVPFFLRGGTALGLGRGTELYPLPDSTERPVLVVCTGVHVATAWAYQALRRDVTDALTSPAESPILREFQTVAWALAERNLDRIPLRNDFEKAVYERFPEIGKLARKLRRLGARPALMTGSGSGVFGIFRDMPEATAASKRFAPGTAFPVRFVSRRRYRSLWCRALGSAASASCFACAKS